MNKALKLSAIATALLTSSLANAASFTFSGNLMNHNDVVVIKFSLANNSTNVRVWTDSFMATGPSQTGPGTNFDPITALWNADTGMLVGQNDDNETIAPGQTYYDSGFSLSTLAAGNYFFTMTPFNNFARSNSYSDGFERDGDTPIPIASWSQPSNAGNLRGTFWRINLDGVDSATNVNAVPVPAAAWLFGSGLLGLAGMRRKQAA